MSLYDDYRGISVIPYDRCIHQDLLYKPQRTDYVQSTDWLFSCIAHNNSRVVFYESIEKRLTCKEIHTVTLTLRLNWRLEETSLPFISFGVAVHLVSWHSSSACCFEGWSNEWKCVLFPVRSLRFCVRLYRYIFSVCFVKYAPYQNCSKRSEWDLCLMSHVHFLAVSCFR